VAERGPVWGAESEELNATLLEWPAGDGPGETVSKLDVVYVVVNGSLSLTVAGEPHELEVGDALIVPKDVPRRPVAGSAGVRYLTAHRRRGLLDLARSTRER
jgi:mannose-6-phosphate isomerase-like protein (cupin superfamily)